MVTAGPVIDVPRNSGHSSSPIGACFQTGAESHRRPSLSRMAEMRRKITGITCRRGRSGGSTSRQERPGPGHRRQATPDHHRRFSACRAVAALVSPGHSGPAARVPSCLTRSGHRPVVWPHEIPASGISHRNTGSSPRSGTEAGDISPVFAALEHAAGDFTTLGKNLGHVKSP
jgi:hypothetical protein